MIIIMRCLFEPDTVGNNLRMKKLTVFVCSFIHLFV